MGHSVLSPFKKNDPHLPILVAETRPGRTVALSVLRGNRLAPGKHILLLVKRGEATVFLSIAP